MTAIVVLRPDLSAPPVAALELAPRRELPERPVIGLVANGKPLANELLTVLADELARRLDREVETVLIAKASAAYTLAAVEADALAARCHVVITGLGD